MTSFIALTLTFIVTRLPGVIATAPGLPISMPAASAPLRFLPVQRAPISDPGDPRPYVGQGHGKAVSGVSTSGGTLYGVSA